MPRGYLKEKEYRKSDIRAYISELMRSQKIRQHHIADALNLTQGRVSQKLDACDFDVDELLTIFKLLDADPDKVGKLLTFK